MSCELAIDGAVVVCMATYPARYSTLASVVATLAHQVDHVFIYANETIDGFPDLSHHGNVIVLDGREHAGNLSANGKIYPLRFLRNCLVLTADDDFLYPPDYVARIRGTFSAFRNRCCTTVHGSILPPSLDWYYERTKVFVVHQQLDGLQIVALAGSGTFAFHQSTLPFAPDDFLSEVMVDLRLSLLARERRLPIWCLPRPPGWLTVLHPEGLWQEMRRTVTHHSIEAREHDWSFEVYREIAREALSGLDPEARSTLSLDPELEQGLTTGAIPFLWRTAARNYLARSDYLRVLAGS